MTEGKRKRLALERQYILKKVYDQKMCVVVFSAY